MAIAPTPTKAPTSNREFVERTREFLKEDGAFKRLETAAATLREAACNVMDPNKCPGIRPHKDGLTMDDVSRITYGDYGACGELAGISAVVKERIHDAPAGVLKDRVRELVAAFDVKPSQLTLTGMVKKVKPALETESVGEALERSVEELNAWLCRNAKHISPERGNAVTAEMYHFRTALHGVRDYMDYARGCVQQAAGRAASA